MSKPVERVLYMDEGGEGDPICVFELGPDQRLYALELRALRRLPVLGAKGAPTLQQYVEDGNTLVRISEVHALRLYVRVLEQRLEAAFL